MGGAGLGFGASAGGGRGGLGSGAGGSVSTHRPGSGFVQLPGFSKSSAEYERESASSTVMPPSSAAGSGAEEAAGSGAPLPPPPPAPPPAALAAAAEAVANAASAPAAVRSFQAGRFKSSFVSSGTTGGDIGAVPMVIAAKVGLGFYEGSGKEWPLSRHQGGTWISWG